MASTFFAGRDKRWKSFTLIELLTVIAIIAILAALTLAAGEAVMTKAARSRTSTEIQAMGAALESYKADNGVYGWINTYDGATFTSTNQYATVDVSSAGGLYMVSGQVLYENLSGKTNFDDPPQPGVKAYMNFKASQVGNATGTGYGASTSTYAQDPFGYSYGYYASPDPNNPPINGPGFFDLWSTGNQLESTASSTPGWTNTWISNWQSQ